MGDEAGIAVEGAAASTPTPGPRRQCAAALSALSLAAPAVLRPLAAFSHSASLGRRAPWALAKASASNQLTWQAAACGSPAAIAG